jgi:hypothetical protein
MTKKPRDKIKNVGLRKEKFSKIKQEFHDIDYAHKLSDKNKEWLSAFYEEDLGARFNHPNKKIYKKRKDRLASYNRNNCRIRDVYANAKASGNLLFEDPLKRIETGQNVDSGINDTEIQMIEYLDYINGEKYQSEE